MDISSFEVSSAIIDLVNKVCDPSDPVKLEKSAESGWEAPKECDDGGRSD